MAVKIRLQRKGAKKRPFYRIVVIDSRDRMSGEVLEVLGTYNPLSDPPDIRLDRERATAWIDKGAQPSDSVGSIIRRVLRSGEAEENVEA